MNLTPIPPKDDQPAAPTIWTELAEAQRALRDADRADEVGPLTRRVFQAPTAVAGRAIIREYLPSDDWARNLLTDVLGRRPVATFPRPPTPIDSDNY